ncbi:MAG TPA: hypothetical protein VHH36_05455 [Candidatus Thermoplasmatota archaeon]|nr:hypothetical protein [Candidatus Thermoplasmatota archaeon]
MDRFLAIQRLPQGASQEGFRESMQRLDLAADQLGIHVTETLYNLDKAMAWSVFEARDEAEVLRAHERAGLPQPEVVRAGLLYTELLTEPRRAR